MVKSSVRPSSALAAAFGACLLAWGCAQVAGLDSDYEAFPGGGGASGDAGGGGEPGGGGQGGAPQLSDNMQALAKPGELCAELGRSACFGHAQKLLLACKQDGDGTLRWAELQFCSGDDLCDSRPRSEIGAKSGTCQAPVPICLSNQPGAHVCDGKTHHICGPDLVSSVAAECGSEVLCALTLESGMSKCAVCKAGVVDCDGDSRRRCNDDQLGFDYFEDCAKQQLFCNASSGNCDVNRCDPNDYACEGSSLQFCADPKVGFTTQQVCDTPPNLICDKDGGQCDQCVKDQARCVGNANFPEQRDDREVCDDNGQGFHRDDCTGDFPFCRGQAPNARCVQCTQDADCAAGNTPCNTRTCNGSNECVNNPKTGPLPAGDQEAGDCKTKVCNDGVEDTVPDTNDVPPDTNTTDCRQPVCEADGDVGDGPVSPNTPCGPGGTGFCGTDGVCGTCAQGQVACADGGSTVSCQPDGSFGTPVPCPGATPFCQDSECHACTLDDHCQPPSGECKTASCAGNNTCVEEDKPDNTLLTDPTPNDCKARVCIGGQPAIQPDSTDVPPDGDLTDCFAPACNNGTLENQPRTPGAPCFVDGTSGSCDLDGNCVTMMGSGGSGEGGSGMMPMGDAGEGGEGGATMATPLQRQ